MPATATLSAPYACDERRPAVPPTAPAKPKAELEWDWNLTPADGSGGYLFIRDGRERSEYRVRMLERDPGMGELWEMRKSHQHEDGRETWGEPYMVSLGFGHDSCTCKGFAHSRKSPKSCRHAICLRAALEWIDNNPETAGTPTVTGEAPF